MSEGSTHTHCWLLILFLLIAGATTSSLQSDKEVLLELKTFLQDKNPFNRGRYTEWNNNSSPCEWPGISCSNVNDERVTGINLSDYNISGKMFGNYSLITELSELDLSQNTIDGPIPDDLNRCMNLRYLNLSHNILVGRLNLTGLTNLVTLDLTVNRLFGGIGLNFPALCNNLVTLNISLNNFTGRIDDCFDECWKLQYLDLSDNNFSGHIWLGFQRLREFSVSENILTGEISPSIFTENCSLKILDLSENLFNGSIPKELSNCKNLSLLNLADNTFIGPTPEEIGTLPNLVTLLLGKNSLSREIPESLLNLSQLQFLDYSGNSFGGDIQEIFGKFKKLQYLVLNDNFYTGGLTTSGILNLQNLIRLDLSSNNFTGPLPVGVSEMHNLKYLALAYNQFNGSIPPEFGNFPAIQALDLSFNRLTGKIPPTIGKLTSLLWLMLANNSLTGEIPHEIGNCSSLLWLNLANNRLSGTIPAEISNIAQNPTPTFESNRNSSRVPAGSGECTTTQRWIPTNYPPFSFVYTLLTRKSCRSIWDSLLKGYPIFPICAPGSMVRTLQITGYLQLTGNQFSGKLPPEIGNLHNFTLLHVGINNLSGELPPEIANMPLMVLDVSYNGFSGEIPSELSNAKCLQNLDLSHNNFSGEFPTSLNNLSELSQFNVSYNPLIYGVVPSTGQLATFDKSSFLGDPLLHLPDFMNEIEVNTSPPPVPSNRKPRENTKELRLIVFLFFFAGFVVGGVLSLILSDTFTSKVVSQIGICNPACYLQH